MRSSFTEYYSLLLGMQVAQKLSRQVFQLLVHVFHRQTVTGKRGVDFTISQLNTELGIHRRTVKEALDTAEQAGLLKQKRTRGRNSRLVLATLPPSPESLDKFSTIPTFWEELIRPKSLSTNAQTLDPLCTQVPKHESDVCTPVPKEFDLVTDVCAPVLKDGEAGLEVPAFMTKPPPVCTPEPKQSTGLNEEDF